MLGGHRVVCLPMFLGSRSAEGGPVMAKIIEGKLDGAG